MILRLSLSFTRAKAAGRSEYRAAMGQGRAQLPNKSLRVPGGLQANLEETFNISRQATSVKTFDTERSPPPPSLARSALVLLLPFP